MHCYDTFAMFYDFEFKTSSCIFFQAESPKINHHMVLVASYARLAAVHNMPLAPSSRDSHPQECG